MSGWVQRMDAWVKLVHLDDVDCDVEIIQGDY